MAEACESIFTTESLLPEKLSGLVEECPPRDACVRFHGCIVPQTLNWAQH